MSTTLAEIIAKRLIERGSKAATGVVLILDEYTIKSIVEGVLNESKSESPSPQLS